MAERNVISRKDITKSSGSSTRASGERGPDSGVDMCSIVMFGGKGCEHDRSRNMKNAVSRVFNNIELKPVHVYMGLLDVGGLKCGSRCCCIGRAGWPSVLTHPVLITSGTKTLASGRKIASFTSYVLHHLKQRIMYWYSFDSFGDERTYSFFTLKKATYKRNTGEPQDEEI